MLSLWFFVCTYHRQLIDRYLTDFSHASSYRKILRAMRILCGNQNAMVIAFCRFCNIIKLQFLYYFKNNVSRAKKLWILMVLILYRNVKSNLHNAPKCLQVSHLQNVNKYLPGTNVYTLRFLRFLYKNVVIYKRIRVYTILNSRSFC